MLGTWRLHQVSDAHQAPDEVNSYESASWEDLGGKRTDDEAGAGVGLGE